MAGEVVRAVAKLTGVPMILRGIRGKVAEHLPVSSSARMPFSARPAAAAVKSGEEAAGEPMPRVVFDGVPTLEEAKEATSELILGIEKIYPGSGDFDGYDNSVTSKHELHSSPSNSQVEQAKASVSGENTTEPAVPTTVYMAFKLLHESPMVQNVVASIACDPNIVKAFRQNQQLQEFLHLERRHKQFLSCFQVTEQLCIYMKYTEQLCWASSHSVTGDERLDMLSAEGIEHSSNDAKSKPGSSFEGLLRIIEDMVVMMKDLPDLFKRVFGSKGDESSENGDPGVFGSKGDKSSENGDPGAPGGSAEHVFEASLFGLVIMVIMLIFLKRG